MSTKLAVLNSLKSGEAVFSYETGARDAVYRLRNKGITVISDHINDNHGRYVSYRLGKPRNYTNKLKAGQRKAARRSLYSR